MIAELGFDADFGEIRIFFGFPPNSLTKYLTQAQCLLYSYGRGGGAVSLAT